MLNTQLKTLTCAIITSCLLMACSDSSSTQSTNVTPTTPSNTNQPTNPTTPTTPPTNTNKPTNPTTPTTPPTNTNQPTNPTTPTTPVSPTTNLLENIPLSASNTFELYDFEYQITANHEPNDFYVDALITVKNGKIQKSVETPVFGKFHEEYTTAFIADNFLGTLSVPFNIPKSNFNEYILGLDKTYVVIRDDRTKEPVLNTMYIKEVDLSDKDASSLLISTPLRPLGLNNVYFPKGSKCWSIDAQSSSKDGYMVNLAEPEDYRSVGEWKDTFDGFHTLIAEKQDRVGVNNVYPTTRLTLKAHLVNQIYNVGLLSINSKFYEGGYLTNQPQTISGSTTAECIFMNKTARDFVVSEIKKYYRL